jgi:hypothetical protein
MPKTMLPTLLVPPLLLLVIGAAHAVTPMNEPFCESRKGGQNVCQYRTMEQCQEAIKGHDATCVPNPNATR